MPEMELAEFTNSLHPGEPHYFHLPYFFSHRMEFIPPSYKMDLDLLDCLGSVKLVL